MTPVLRSVFFDLDETLWDFRKNSQETLLDMLQQKEMEPLAAQADLFIERYHEHNERCWSLYHAGALTRDELRFVRWQQTLSDFQMDDENLVHHLSERYLEILPTKKHLLDDARELLDYLKPKYRLHIITNGFEQVQMKKIHGSGLFPYFTHIITSEKAGCKKQDPLIFRYALELTGADINESVFIGDSLEADIAGARAAGMKFYWFNPERKIPAVPVEPVVFALSELQEIL